jgi:hypothetical protein
MLRETKLVPQSSPRGTESSSREDKASARAKFVKPGCGAQAAFVRIMVNDGGRGGLPSDLAASVRPKLRLNRLELFSVGLNSDQAFHSHA